MRPLLLTNEEENNSQQRTDENLVFVDASIQGVSELAKLLGLRPSLEQTPMSILDPLDNSRYDALEIITACTSFLSVKSQDMVITYQATKAMHREISHMYERILGTPFIPME